MDLSISRDELGRLVCTVDDAGQAAVIVAPDLDAAAHDLLAALEDAAATGYGECLWLTGGGDYRWMFRRAGDRLVVVALWSRGTVTGWQHVVHGETDFADFDLRVRAGLAGIQALFRP